LQLLFHMLRAMKSYLSCRNIHMETLSQQIPRAPFSLNGLGHTNIVSLSARHKSTKHSFSFSRQCPAPEVDPEPGRSLMDENPTLTAAPDPTARLAPGYGGGGGHPPPTIARGGIVASRPVIYSYLLLIPGVVFPFTFLANFITL
jgi:hypothetical protein